MKNSTLHKSMKRKPNLRKPTLILWTDRFTVHKTAMEGLELACGNRDIVHTILYIPKQDVNKLRDLLIQECVRLKEV